MSLDQKCEAASVLEDFRVARQSAFNCLELLPSLQPHFERADAAYRALVENLNVRARPLFDNALATSCAADASQVPRMPQNPSHPQSVGSEASTRIAELEAALEPFADVARVDIGETESDDDAFRNCSPVYARAPSIRVGHLRAALRSLSGEG